ncbi:MAG: ATP synthase F1 subunit delta [Bacteroidales bacterium]|nr:ATP synthase F1 subunit delta [Bacteroidales bacterium]
MNRSIIVTRYARSLVKLVRETGQGSTVCSQAESLVKSLHEVSELQRMIKAADDVVPPSQKKELMQKALGGEMAPDLKEFLSLLNRNGRMEMVEDILRDFVDLYRRSVGIRKAHLTTVTEPSEHLLERLKALVKKKTGDDVIIEVDVDPSLIGGFVFDIENYLLDASIKRQLDRIREQFVERNRRII